MPGAQRARLTPPHKAVLAPGRVTHRLNIAASAQKLFPHPAGGAHAHRTVLTSPMRPIIILFIAILAPRPRPLLLASNEMFHEPISYNTVLRKLKFLKAAQRVLEEEGSGYACHPRTCEAWQCVWRTAIALQRPSSRAAAPVPRHALIVLHFPALHCPQTAAAPGSPSRLRAGPRPARAVRRCLREIFGADVAVQRTV